MRVAVVANCQATPICNMLQEARPDWEITKWIVFYPETLQRLAEYRASIAAADLILCQSVEDGYAGVDELATSWLRANKRASTDLLVVHNLFFRGQHPGQYSIPLNGQVFTFLNQPYQDVVAMHALLTLGEDQAHQIVMRPDGGVSENALQTVAQPSFAEMKLREIKDSIDISVTDVIEDQWRDVALFHSFNHPTRAMCLPLVNRILEAVGERARVSAYGPEHLGEIHFPVHPSVGNVGSTGDTFRVLDRVFTRSEFYREYFKYLIERGPEIWQASLYKYPDVPEFIESAFGRPQTSIVVS